MSALPSIAPQLEQPPAADATADLYARHSARIFGYCLGLLRNREEAEDAVQTTFLNAYRGLRRGIEPEYEAAWLFKIAQNVCRTRRESAWRRGKVETVRDLDALQDVVAAPEQASGQATELTEALKRMPERYRTIILLREWQGLSYREIAVETGLSEGAVEMLVFRARRSLAENLEHAEAPRARALSLSSALSLLKSLLGSAGVKAVVAAVAVTATAIAVSTAHEGHTSPVRPSPAGPPAVEGNAKIVVPAQTSARRPARNLAPVPDSTGKSTPPVQPGVSNAVAVPPTSGKETPSAPPSGSPTPTTSVPAPSPPPVPVPDVSIPTPGVTVPSGPSVPVPETPPLPVGTGDLPVTAPDLHLP